MKYCLFVCACLLLSCGQKPSTNNKGTDIQGRPAATAEQSDNALPGYPSITRDLMVNLYKDVTLIDYIFHNMPFSLSQSEKAAIQTNLSYISTTPMPQIPAACKPIGRQFYQIEGEIVLEADIYFQEGCRFYVFIVNGNPTYANLMTEQGVQFFSSVIAQAYNVTRQQQ